MAFMLFEGPNFMLEVPTNWVVTSSPQLQAIFFGPQDTVIRPNMVISLRAVEANVTYQAVAQAAKETQEKEYPSYTILSEVDFAEFGGIGMKRHYSWVNPTNNAKVVQIQTYFVAGQVLFTLTASRGGHLNDQDADELDGVFEHMIETFRITQ
ncbi:MAG: DUF1795 domain-containing protein [Anaerolineae bacterium]|nr:DUF1795 domain-containing protein [Anaerolineae bacterium]